MKAATTERIGLAIQKSHAGIGRCGGGDGFESFKDKIPAERTDHHDITVGKIDHA